MAKKYETAGEWNDKKNKGERIYNSTGALKGDRKMEREKVTKENGRYTKFYVLHLLAKRRNYQLGAPTPSSTITYVFAATIISQRIPPMTMTTLLLL